MTIMQEDDPEEDDKKKGSILVPLCTDAGTNTAYLSLSLSVPPLLLNLSPLNRI